MADAAFRRALIHTCQVQAPVTERVGAELQVSYGAAQTVRCRYIPASERWAAEERTRLVYRRHHLLVQADAPVDRRCRISNIVVRSSQSVVDPGPFIVTEVQAFSDGQRTHHLEVEMERAD